MALLVFWTDSQKCCYPFLEFPSWKIVVFVMRKSRHHQPCFTREPTGVNNYLYLQCFTEPLYNIHLVFSISGTANEKGEVSSVLLQRGVISTVGLDEMLQFVVQLNCIMLKKKKTLLV